MYAVLDIETTGGKYNEEGITEIAIYRFDGHRVVDQFSSLINPERPIQPFVVNLTGINNDMLRQAPKFYEVAKRIIEITEGCILVAHNALFDSRILTTEFDRLGYRYEREALCTVDLSKKLLPDLPSYSLGKLVRTLGIPLSDRHRAQGDAKATVSLFKILLDKDVTKEIVSQTLLKDPKRDMEPKFLDIINSLPSERGVFYIRDKEEKIVYIEAHKNIRKRVLQHFSNDRRLSKKIQSEVSSVAYERTGNELISQLKVYAEIKKTQPKYNRKTQRSLYSYQLVAVVDTNGYLNLKIERADGRKGALATFSNYQQAKRSLEHLIAENHLCSRLSSLESSDSGACDYFVQTKCHKACLLEESAEDYNQRVRNAVENIGIRHKNMLVIDQGRAQGERSVIWIENGKYRGYGYFNLNHQINNPEILQSLINQVEGDKNSAHLIGQYLRKRKGVKIINLSST